MDTETAMEMDPELELAELESEFGGEFEEDEQPSEPSMAMVRPIVMEPVDEGWSTGQKLGAAAGVAGLVGLAGWGLWRVGSNRGWWGQSPIILDDPAEPGGSSGGSGSGSGSGSGVTSSRKRAIGNPPNITGDPKGFNTVLWNSPGPMRLALITQGYKVAATQAPLVEEGESHPKIQQLQSDWNRVIRGIDSGKVVLPSSVDKLQLLKHYRGILKVDGIPGKNSLNALEVMFTNYRDNGVFWNKLLEQAR